MLAEDELSFLLQRFAGIAVQNCLNLLESPRLVLAHHGVQRQKLHFIALPRLNLHRLAGLNPNLNHQCVAIVDPAAFGIAAAQFRAAILRRLELAQLVLRIGLPVERPIRMVAMLGGHARKVPDRVGPPGFIDGPRSIREQSAVRRF